MLAAAVMLVPAMTVAANGPARPVTGPDSQASRQAASAGVISTMAGGVGGPTQATRVGMRACGVSLGNGSLYVADEWSVRKVSPATDALTTPAGHRGARAGG